MSVVLLLVVDEPVGGAKEGGDLMLGGEREYREVRPTLGEKDAVEWMDRWMNGLVVDW